MTNYDVIWRRVSKYTAIKTLVNKTKKAFDNFQPASVVIAGGVAS
ncbi:hypothetical protein [Candidatus Minimicrobia vallesae]|nr:hypothetical protein [Candidatus Minimicrobia vallesae]